jgi:hypothetical protein
VYEGSRPLPFQTLNADARCHVLSSPLSLWDSSRLGSLLFHGPFDFENVEVPSPDSTGSCATYPSDDRWLRVNWRITIHEFDVHEALHSTLRYVDVQFQSDSSVHVRVNPLATPLQSEGLRGFSNLIGKSKSAILFLLRILVLPTFLLVQIFPRPVPST